MSKSTPKAPDYEAAAEAQGQSSRENIEQQTWANRPTQNTPFGQQSWEPQPDVGSGHRAVPEPVDAEHDPEPGVAACAGRTDGSDHRALRAGRVDDGPRPG